jgi:hypothetical protein
MFVAFMTTSLQPERHGIEPSGFLNGVGRRPGNAADSG